MVSFIFLLIFIADTRCQALPNFVFIIADDMGFNEIGYRKTTNTYSPNFDNLCDTGLELSRFYVYAKCSPTRMSFMTGRMVHKLGVQDQLGLTSFLTCGVEPKLENTFFINRLKHCAQYNNYLIGKWHLGMYKHSYLPKARGFDYAEGYLGPAVKYDTFMSEADVDDEGNPVYDWRVNDIIQPQNWESSNYEYYTTHEIGKRAVTKINNMTTDKPFALIINMQAPHGPIHPSPEYDELLDLNVGLYAANNDDQRKEINSMIYSMDLQIEDIVDALENSGVWSNTLLFFFSDNGGVKPGANYPLRGKKATYWEGGIRVPACINGGYLSTSLKGKSYDKPVHVSDIFATLMDITDINTNDLQLDGKSFKNVLDATTPPTGPRDRDTIILSANSGDCKGTYQGEKVCGAILKDYGNDGIFKLSIGKDIAGTGTRGWEELKNQVKIDATIDPSISIFSCNPTNDATLSKPIWDETTWDTYCSNMNKPCLFDLTKDPCEYRDLSLSKDTNHQSKLDELAQLLITAYNEQVEPFDKDDKCSQIKKQEIQGFWGEFSPSRVEPFACKLADDACDPPIYTDTGECIAEDINTPPPKTTSTTVATYMLNTEPMKRDEAVAACGSGGLLSIPEDSDIQSMTQTLKDYNVPAAWIGLQRDPDNKYKYKWDDGTPCDDNVGDDCTIYWGPDDPSNVKECVVLKKNGDFVTERCKEIYPFLCHTSSSSSEEEEEEEEEEEDDQDDNLINVFFRNNGFYFDHHTIVIILVSILFGMLMHWILLRLCGYKIQKASKPQKYDDLPYKQDDDDTECSDTENVQLNEL